jgi:hypothetical protein
MDKPPPAPSDPLADAAAPPGSVAEGDEGRGDIDLRIARDGRWYYHGSLIARKPLVRLFATVLRREGDGEYYLVTPVERCRVEVEDAPFIAVELAVSGRGQRQSLDFRTNLDERVVADARHPIRVDHDSVSGEPRPYLMVRAGLEALISRPVYYQLVELGVERKVGGDYLYGVWSEASFFALGSLSEREPSA